MKRAIALEAALVAMGVLTGAALFGQQLLSILGISLASFRIAGGLLLFAIAFEMVFEKRQERKNNSVVARPSPAVFPLGIPLMAGPGAITAAILLAGRAGGDWLLLGLFVATIAVVVAMCLCIFLVSGQVERLLGERGQNVLGRLLGVLLAALAVQYVADGVVALKAL
jgi:multiple antibiotic resistance protein